VEVLLAEMNSRVEKLEKELEKAKGEIKRWKIRAIAAEERRGTIEDKEDDSSSENQEIVEFELENDNRS